MSDLEISTLGDNKLLQSWATKCDANHDGKIDKDESSVFEQGRDSMDTDTKGKTTVTVGGVTVNINDVSVWKTANKNSDFDYSLKLSNGVTCNYDTQPIEADAKITRVERGKPYNWSNQDNTYTHLANFTNGDGIEVIGSNKTDDQIFIENSKILKIDGLAGQDHVSFTKCKGNEYKYEKGETNVFAELIDFDQSFNFNVTNSSQTTASQPPTGQADVYVQDKNIIFSSHNIDGIMNKRIASYDRM